ncbi:histidine--tRNA ligase, partial [bacterium]
MTITAVRGFNDILPGETGLWRHIEAEAFKVFSSYGFSEIKTPLVEKTELFSRSIGETTDIVEKEMYTFPDRHGDSLTLRPEGTASVVRAFVEHRLYVTPVVKLFYSGPMFRYERPQKGRYRQFYQIGAEVLGTESPKADAEVISMLMALFERLELKGVALNINSLGCAGCRPAYKEQLRAYLYGVTEKLCENCVKRIDANPLRALDCKSAGCVEATASAPAITTAICPSCKGHFEKVLVRLGELNIKAKINPRMVRGLDYYTKTTFEITAEGLGAQNAVAAGGRYDGLVTELGGPETHCIGFAIGVERLALLLGDSLDDKYREPLVAFIPLGVEAYKEGAAIVKGWREAGLRIIEDYDGASLKSSMKLADRLGADYAAILGEDELKQGVVTLKNMKTAAQEKISWDKLASRINEDI